MDPNQYLLMAALVGVAAFMLYLLTLGMYWWRQRMRLSYILYRGLLIGLVVSAGVYVVANMTPNSIQLTFFSDWWRISEIGYQALWLRVARTALPFMLVGFALPFAFRGMNDFVKVAIFSFLAALVLGVAAFALGRFNPDDLIYAFWGAMAGFALLCVVAGLIPRLKVFVSMNLSKYAYAIGAFVLMGTFFIGVGTLFANNGPTYVELQFSQSDPLPADTVISTTLNADRSKAPTFTFVQADVAADSARVAKAMGMNGEVRLEGKNQGIGVVEDGEKALTLYSAGNWIFEDGLAANMVGAIPDDNTAERLARQVAVNGAARKYEVYASRVESRMDENGLETGKLVWLTAATPEGAKIVGACEFKILVGPGGGIVKVEKFDADFQTAKKERIISSREAYDLIMSRGLREDGKEISVAHTLYSPARSVNVTQAEIAYWLEGARGVLQPIWLFSATATLEDGSSTDFEIYVPALRY